MKTPYHQAWLVNGTMLKVPEVGNQVMMEKSLTDKEKSSWS